MRARAHVVSAPPPQRPGGRELARRRSERRQRELRFRRRRLDLLQDVGLAVLATIVLITLTAGLGVLLLLVLAAGGVRAASVVVPRVLRWRRERRA